MSDKEIVELIKEKYKDEEFQDKQRLSQDTKYVIGFIRGMEYTMDVYSKRPA
jgi:hypothetical protein